MINTDKLTNMFDPSKDYMEELTSSEVFEVNGVRCVLLKGLKRLAYLNRGGVSFVGSIIVHTPARDNPIASVTVTYSFEDGTSFAGSADATPAAHKAPYSLHLVAVAESKAEARALRRAFNISTVSFEELGSAPVAGGNTDMDKITDGAIHGIRVLAKRKGLTNDDLVKMTGGKAVTDLNQLEGRTLMKKINSKKVK